MIHLFTAAKRHRIILWIGLMLFLPMVKAHAGSESAFFWESIGMGDFMQIRDETYIPLYAPVSDCYLTSSARWGWYIPDGMFGLGFAQQSASVVYLNQEAGELFYDLYHHQHLSRVYEHLSGQITSYHRQDIVMDLNVAHGPWTFQGGIQLMEGSGLFCFVIRDGTASEAEGQEIPYDIRGRYALWKGYADDLGHGTGYHFTLQYQPSQRFSLLLSGRDLGGKLEWSHLDEYHGTVNLNLIREENGISYVHAPLEGIYVSDGFLRLPLTPVWRGELRYGIGAAFQVRPWVEYHTGWDLGIQGTWLRDHELTVSLGMARSHRKWLAEGTVEWRWLALEGAVTFPGPLTGYRLGVRIKAF